MPYIEAFDGLATLAGVRLRGERDRVARAREPTSPMDGLQSVSPGARGLASVFEVVAWGAGVIVYRATGRRPWTIDGETMPWLAFRSPKFERLLGGVALVGPYAIWLVCARGRRRDAGKEDLVSVSSRGDRPAGAE